MTDFEVSTSDTSEAVAAVKEELFESQASYALTFLALFNHFHCAI
jgi:hypothetical protein